MYMLPVNENLHEAPGVGFWRAVLMLPFDAQVPAKAGALVVDASLTASTPVNASVRIVPSLRSFKRIISISFREWALTTDAFLFLMRAHYGV
jgi:hypothetical protein